MAQSHIRRNKRRTRRELVDLERQRERYRDSERHIKSVMHAMAETKRMAQQGMGLFDDRWTRR